MEDKGLLPKEESKPSAKNGLSGGHQQQQRVYLLDEDGSANANLPQAIDEMLRRPARVWRPERSRSWGKRKRQLLLRMATLAGTVALGIGLLLLLWLALMLSPGEKQAVSNGSDVPPANSTSQMASSTSPSPPNLATSSSSSTTPPSTSRPHKLRLSIDEQQPQPSGTGSRRPKFRGNKLVQMNAQPQQQSPQQHQNVIRVTAPARAMELDRMEAKKEEAERRRTKVWAFHKGGQWGEAETTTTTGKHWITTTTPRLTSASSTTSRTTTTVIHELSFQSTAAKTDEQQQKEVGGIESSTIVGNIAATVANSSEESRTREEEDYDDLFWRRDKPKSPPFSTQEMPTSPLQEKPESLSSLTKSLAGDIQEMAKQEVPNALTPQNLKMPVPTEQMPTPTTATPFPTDGYEPKRPTIEFGPVQAKAESSSSEEMAGTTGRPATWKAEEEATRGTTEDAILRQELNEIIESFERERPSTASRGQQLSSLEEIHPVEIPFDPFISSQPPQLQQVPVWRRPPPDESEEDWSRAPPRPPPRPPMPPARAAGSSFNLQAKMQTRKLDGKGLIKERQNQRRKRREAPVLVTALLDIGRGEWQRFTRHFDQYLGYLTNILLRLQNNIVLYCDPSVVAYLRALGNKLDWERIQIVEISLPELPFYKFRPEIEDIMRWEQANWHGEWDKQMQAHPETLYPDYDILVNSKPYFLYNATQISRFPRPIGTSEQFFAWLDAGYGHGSKTAIPSGVWSPQLQAGQITLVKLPTLVERVERYTLDKVYRKQRSVVSGGFLAGDDRVIRRFWTFFTKTFMELLDQRKVDDDQTTLLLTIQRYNSTFNLMQGGWFDALSLLKNNASSSQ